MSKFGNDIEHLIYGTINLVAAAGVALSVLFSKLFKQNKNSAKLLLYACYPLAALLLIAASFATTRILFFSLVIPFYLLVGLNVGLCARFLSRVFPGGGAGKLLSISTCAGLIVTYLLNLAVSFDSPMMIRIYSVCIAIAIFAMMFVAMRALDISGLMHLSEKPNPNSKARRRYLYVLSAICLAIVIMSYMIGINDIIIYTTLLESTVPAYFLSQLFYIPGIFIAGLLADIRLGKYLPIATLACVVLAIPVITLLNRPELYTAYSGITYFIGGFFLIYIMMSLCTIIERSHYPVLLAPLAGFLFFLFSGLGALSSQVFIQADIFVSLTVYAALALCLMLVFYFSGGLRAVSLADPEPHDVRSDQTLNELITLYHLTNREAEVLSHLLNGATTVEVAEKMFVTEKTVYKYISSLLAKTDTPSRSAMLMVFSGKNH